MTADFSLSGGVALVTGAGSGIGRAIALGLADAGALVGCVDQVSGQPDPRSDSSEKVISVSDRGPLRQDAGRRLGARLIRHRRAPSAGAVRSSGPVNGPAGSARNPGSSRATPVRVKENADRYSVWPSATRNGRS